METNAFDIINTIEDKIITIDNQTIIVDADIALLYGVPTRDINKAVKNNPEKFPEGYIIKLSKDKKDELVENFHRFNTLKHSTVNPNAFTEKGLYMLATILKSSKATETTIAIIETFAKIRELGRNINQIATITDNSEHKTLLQQSNKLISDIFEHKLGINETETTIEINLALLKLKHTIKAKKKENNE